MRQTTRAQSAIAAARQQRTDHAAWAAPRLAIDRSDKPGHVGVVLLVARLLVGAAIGLGFVASE